MLLLWITPQIVQALESLGSSLSQANEDKQTEQNSCRTGNSVGGKNVDRDKEVIIGFTCRKTNKNSRDIDEQHS